MVTTRVGTDSGTSTALSLRAPAKINLHLRVGPPGSDGFHPLVSWMCTVSLFDTLELRIRRPLSGNERGSVGDHRLITMTCDDPRLPCDESNLVVKAGRLVAGAIAEKRRGHRATREGVPSSTATGATTGATNPETGTALGESEETAPVAVVLGKNVPFGAGLGGGSSDGATAMLGLNRLWQGGLERDELARLSSQCGSDLPFFFYGPSSICTGRGEHVMPIAAPSVARWAVLILPDIAMPTPPVYRKFDELGLGKSFDLEKMPDWLEWSNYSSNKLLPLLVNDLESAAFALQPKLGELRNRVESRLGRPVRMSGSGSSLFTLFDERPEAEIAAKEVTTAFAVKAVAVEVSPQDT